MILLAIIISILTFNFILIYFVRKKPLFQSMPGWVQFVAVAAMVIGLVFIFWQSNKIEIEFQKRNWGITQGEIVESQILGERAIRAEVKYKYTIKDSVYFGNSDYHIPGFGTRNYREKNARIVKKDNPVGKKLKVFYNPENPAISTLRYGPYYSNYMIIGFGSFLFLTGMFVTQLRLLKKYFKN